MSELQMTPLEKIKSAMDDCTEVESLMIDITDEIASAQLIAEDFEGIDEEQEFTELVNKFDAAIQHLQCARSKFIKGE